MDLKPPEHPTNNVKWRKSLRKWAALSKQRRDRLNKLCAEDYWFWLKSFAWIYEPRPSRESPDMVQPFLPWPHQVPAMQAVLDNLGFEDIGMEKARGEGATWMCLTILWWRWRFHKMQSFGIVSRSEEAADSPDDSDSLGWKLDWITKMQPAWMVGEKNKDWMRNVSRHTWFHKWSESMITAYAAKGDLASGGRKTAFFMDELSKFPRGTRNWDEEAMAATEPVTNCRLLVSTPYGADGAYYHAMTKKSSMKKIILDWRDNPTRNKDMFRVDLASGRLLMEKDGSEWSHSLYPQRFFRELAPILEDHGFDLRDDQRVWSPWLVDRACRPRMTSVKIAREYERDYGGSVSKFFPGGMIAKRLLECRPPLMTYEPHVNDELCRIRRLEPMRDGGRLKLWCHLDAALMPPRDYYVIGGDVASGQGGTMSSNSTLSIFNRSTMRKVGMYASPNILPEDLARLAVALARLFIGPNDQEAYLIWEVNGAGGNFRNELIENTDFRHIHYRTTKKRIASKRTKEPGFWSAKDSKRELMSAYRQALTEGSFENPEEIALQECLCYIEGLNGKLEYIPGEADVIDPANQGELHGDRVIADALAYLGAVELNGSRGHYQPDTIKRPMAEAPTHSFLGRRNQYLAQKRSREDW
jgi:hypothetical protein